MLVYVEKRLERRRNRINIMLLYKWIFIIYIIKKEKKIRSIGFGLCVDWLKFLFILMN